MKSKVRETIKKAGRLEAGPALSAASGDVWLLLVLVLFLVLEKGRKIEDEDENEDEHSSPDCLCPPRFFAANSPAPSRVSDFLRISDFGFRIFSPLRTSLLILLTVPLLSLASPAASFHDGVEAYAAADYSRAATAFRAAATAQPASGTLQNLGNAEWQRNQVGPAVVAWEQALWVDPFNQPASANLRFARRMAQLEAPELAWYEVVSTWLPVSWWAWIAGASLWLAVGMTMLPGILRRRKTAWQQAVAAVGLMVFLLSLPAQVGVHARSRIGFVLQKDTPLRLTPTEGSQAITRMAPGDPARWERERGGYLLIRTSRALGWIQRDQFGLICPR